MNTATLHQTLTAAEHGKRLAGIIDHLGAAVVGTCMFDGKPYGILLRTPAGSHRVVPTVREYNRAVRKAAASLPDRAVDGVGVPLVRDACPGDLERAGL